MAEYRLSPAAQRDIDAIFEYTVEHWGLNQALAYTEHLEAALSALAEAPLRSQDRAVIRSGYRSRAVGQHILYFRQAAYGIAVIRILHQRMDAERHL